MVNAIPLTLISSYVSVQYDDKLKTLKRGIAAKHQAELTDIQRQQAQWQKFDTSIKDASYQLDTVRMRVGSMVNLVNNMIRTLTQAESSENPSGYASTFNSYLNSLHTTATNDQGGSSLIGKTQGGSLNYPINIYGSEATISGTFLGSSYHIDDTDGLRWIVDRELNTIKRWQSYPDTGSTNGEAANLKDGLKFISEVGDTVTFEYGTYTANPQTFTGTLTRQGIGVVDAWFYESLSTTDGRTRAMEDLESALSFLKSEEARYSAAAEVVAYHQSRIEIVTSELSAKTDATFEASGTEQMAAEDEIARQKAVASAALAAQQSGYSELVGMLSSGKKTGPLQFTPTSLFSIKA